MLLPADSINECDTRLQAEVAAPLHAGNHAAMGTERNDGAQISFREFLFFSALVCSAIMA